jgi:hypothetical protein
MHNILKYNFIKFKNKIKNQGQLFSLCSKVSLLSRRFLASSERQYQVQIQKSSSKKKSQNEKI